MIGKPYLKSRHLAEIRKALDADRFGKEIAFYVACASLILGGIGAAINILT